MNAQSWVNLAGVLIASGIVTILFNWLRARRTAPTENTVRMSDAAVKQVQSAMAQVTSAMGQVDQLQEQVAHATQAARDSELASNDARRESDKLRRELGVVTEAAERLEARIARMAELIHDPYMTIDRLRAMIPPPKVNGGN